MNKADEAETNVVAAKFRLPEISPLLIAEVILHFHVYDNVGEYEFEYEDLEIDEKSLKRLDRLPLQPPRQSVAPGLHLHRIVNNLYLIRLPCSDSR